MNAESMRDKNRGKKDAGREQRVKEQPNPAGDSDKADIQMRTAEYKADGGEQYKTILH